MSDLQHQLHELLHELEKVLPAQAPIKDFVHHNTLHGFQHLPFPEALETVAGIVGQSAWMPEARCRQFYQEGRVTEQDLLAALDELEIPAGGAVGGVTRRQVQLASLLLDRALPAAAQWQWLGEEGRRPEQIDSDRWQACAALAPPLPAPVPRDWQAESLSIWQALAARVGPQWSLRRLLHHLTGNDIQAALQPLLIRHLAAHLDRGTAAWHNPGRSQGFYAAWRHSVGIDPAWDLEELPNARRSIEALPPTALEALAAELPRLGLDRQHWGAYLQRLSLELPGWSGMILWHHEHPQPESAVDMVDYLAVRLALERLYAADLCQSLWGVPLTLEDLGGYFQQHPAELWVRHHGVDELGWPDPLLHRAHRLMALALTLEGQHDEAPWQALAADMASWQEAQAGDEARRQLRQTWPLYTLCRHLSLASVSLQAVGREGVSQWLAWAEELSPAQRGLVWLTAYERHYRQEIFQALHANHGRYQAVSSAEAQVIFCMDDREEGSRRHLEEVNPRIETYGAAGFFGLPLYWRSLDGHKREALCPVVVQPTSEIREQPSPETQAVAGNYLRRLAWRRRWREALNQESRRGLLLGPLLTSFTAPLALATLLVGSLAPARWAGFMRRSAAGFDMPVKTRLAVTAVDEAPPGTPETPRQGYSTEEQIQRVAAFLRTIGLTRQFAPLVVFMGHGSNSRNNPHLSAYDCGACSGRHGGANARAFAAIANRPEVRQGLLAEGIAIPESCWFIGAEHNTCDEAVTWYDADLVPASHGPAWSKFRRELDEALARHAVERCRRLASAPLGLSQTAARRHVAHRRHDASQARPELGHATNACAFVGRRDLSRGAFFDRRAFLISYDPSIDPEGLVLENLLLAAGPVGAGISLEYYFSTVNNPHFGCGSKITHNVTGFLGVMEGASSDLRTGLPRQMIEVHEAMRLLVVVEHRTEVLTAIYRRQPPLQELIGQGWILLAAKSPDGPEIDFFNPRLGWVRWQPAEGELPVVAESLAWCRDSRDPLPPALLTRPLEARP